MIASMICGFAAALLVAHYAAALFGRMLSAPSSTSPRTAVPSITFVISGRDLGEGIQPTLASILDQDYPSEEISIVVVDDGSVDGTYVWACEAVKGRAGVTTLRNPTPLGPSGCMARALRHSDSELLVWVAGGAILSPDAAASLAAAFEEDKVGIAVGRTLPSNASETALTRLQAVERFFIHAYWSSVKESVDSFCFSRSALVAYRRSALLRVEPVLSAQHEKRGEVLDQPAWMSGLVLADSGGASARWVPEARCALPVPASLSAYLEDQLNQRCGAALIRATGMLRPRMLNPAQLRHHFCVLYLFFAYPFAFLECLAGDALPQWVWVQVAVAGLFAAIYSLDPRSPGVGEKVSPWAFMAMGLLMPVTHGLFGMVAMLAPGGDLVLAAPPGPPSNKSSAEPLSLSHELSGVKS